MSDILFATSPALPHVGAVSGHREPRFRAPVSSMPPTAATDDPTMHPHRELPAERIVHTSPGSRIAYVVSNRVATGPGPASPVDDRTTFCAIIVDPDQVTKLASDVTAILDSTAHLDDPIFRDFALLRWLSRSNTHGLHVLGQAVTSDDDADRYRRSCYYSLIEALAEARVGRIVMSSSTYPRIREFDTRTHASAAGEAIVLRHSSRDSDPLLEVGYALDWALRHDRSQPKSRRIVTDDAVTTRLRSIDGDH